MCLPVGKGMGAGGIKAAIFHVREQDYLTIHVFNHLVFTLEL